MPSLILLKSPEGASANKSVPLNADQMVIGRDENGCQIVIPHHAVSRRHAQIVRSYGRFYIEDLKSRNKTFVNSKEVTPGTPQPLKPDDRIKICDFLFRFYDERVIKPKELPVWMRKGEQGDPLSDAIYVAPGGIIGGAQPVPDYMAPEQIYERADHPLTPATDLHAVGVILFQMLTGELPFPPGLTDSAKLDVIVNRRFVSCEEQCRSKQIVSRLAPLIDRCLRGGEYRQARFLLHDLNAPELPGADPIAAPAVGEEFTVGPFLFEDRWSEAFVATGVETGAPVMLRLVKPRYDDGEVGGLIQRLVPTPEAVPPGFLRRHRVGRGQPLPVRAGARFAVDAAARTGGCLALVEEFAGTQTLSAAIEAKVFVGDDEAVLRVAVPLLETLDYVHERGAIHARITPYCVFLPGVGIKLEGIGRLPNPIPRSGPVAVGVHAQVDAIRLRQGGDADDGMSISTMAEAMRGQGNPQQFLEVAPSDRLRALLEISANLSRTLELDPLLNQVADTLFGVFKQADRCFVILLDEYGRQVPKVLRRRRPALDDTRFSKTIVKRTIDSMQSYLSEDASSDATLGPAASIAEFKIRSVMCVPLLDTQNRAFGALQLDTLDRAKKFSLDDLNLLTIIANLAAVVIEKARLHEALLSREGEQKEMELGRKVQLGFLPQALPAVCGYEFFSHYSPAQAVGGDFYDFVSLPGGRVAVVLGDVAGKGVPAALLGAKVISELLRCFLADGSEAVVERLNARLMRGELGDRFVTLVVAVLDPAAHAVTVVNAGHMSPKLIRAATGEVADAISSEATGLPLGVTDEFDLPQVRFDLEPGDAVVVFSDGVTDALNPAGACLGFEAVHNALAGTPDGPKRIGERLVAAVRGHAGGRAQNDDITVVCFGRTEGRA